MGIFDGAGIHGTDQIGSLGTAASHGCVRMAIPDVIELYDKVPGRGAGLHRLERPQTPIASTGTSSHPASSREAWRPEMPNAQGAYEHAPFPLAQHRVPHGGGVAWPLDRVPRLHRVLVVVRQARLHELRPGGHPAVLSVDEEHSTRRVLNPSWGRALAGFDAALRAAGHGREDPPGLRGRPRPARRVGLGRRPGARGRSTTAPCAATPACCPSAARRRPRWRASWRRSAPSTASCCAPGEVEANPADLVASPRKDSHLPTVLKQAEVGDLLGRMPASTPAGAARPRDLRALLLGGPARRGAGEPRRGEPGPRRRGAARGGQGRAHPDRARGRAGLAGARGLPRPRAGPRWRPSPTPRCSSPRAAGGCPRPTSAGAWRWPCAAPRSRPASRRTRCATRSPPICSRVERTSDRSRSCSGTRPSARPRPTLG